MSAPGLVRLRAFLPALLGFLTAFFFGFFFTAESAAFLSAGFVADLFAGLPLSLFAGFFLPFGLSSLCDFLPGTLPAFNCERTLAGACSDLPEPFFGARRREYLSCATSPLSVKFIRRSSKLTDATLTVTLSPRR